MSDFYEEYLLTKTAFFCINILSTLIKNISNPMIKSLLNKRLDKIKSEIEKLYYEIIELNQCENNNEIEFYINNIMHKD